MTPLDSMRAERDRALKEKAEEYGRKFRADATAGVAINLPEGLLNTLELSGMRGFIAGAISERETPSQSPLAAKEADAFIVRHLQRSIDENSGSGEWVRLDYKSWEKLKALAAKDGRG